MENMQSLKIRYNLYLLVFDLRALYLEATRIKCPSGSLLSVCRQKHSKWDQVSREKCQFGKDVLSQDIEPCRSQGSVFSNMRSERRIVRCSPGAAPVGECVFLYVK